MATTVRWAWCLAAGVRAALLTPLDYQSIVVMSGICAAPGGRSPLPGGVGRGVRPVEIVRAPSRASQHSPATTADTTSRTTIGTGAV